STQPTNDFSVSLNPKSGSIKPGASTTSTVSTAVVSGAAQSVTLSASGAPSGVSVSFNPASVTAGGTSTMTISASSTAADASATISHVKLTWEAAYAKSYTIQTSADGTTWTTIFSTTTGNGGTDDLTGLSGTGRYVRILGTARGTAYGYSLYEMQVYGTLS